MQQTAGDPLELIKGLLSDGVRLTRLAASAVFAIGRHMHVFPVFPPVETWPWRILAAPAVMIVVHYILYALIKCTGMAQRRTTIDRLLWFSVSSGCTIAWTYMLYPLFHLGGADASSAVVQTLLSSYMLSWVVMSLYYWISGLTSTFGAPSGAFYIRKSIPVVAVVLFPFALVPALSPLHEGHPFLKEALSIAGRSALVGWLIRYAILDSLIDFTVLTRSNVLRKLLAGPWAVLFWQMYGTYNLQYSSILGRIPCYAISALAVGVVIFDLVPSYSVVSEQEGFIAYTHPYGSTPQEAARRVA